MKDLYKNILRDLLENWNDSAPRWQNIKELLNFSVKIDDILNVWYEYPSRKFLYKYISSELLWYLSWDLSVDNIWQYANLWNTIQNEDWLVNSNYWYLVFYRDILTNNWWNQYEWALNSLKQDKESRQAFIRYNHDWCQELFEKDVICTYYQQFFIRDNQLHCINSMRSNDIIYGFTADVVWFSLVHQSLYLDLKETYPELELWCMWHNANSMHIYEPMFNKAKQLILEEWTNIKIELKQSLYEQLDKDYDKLWEILKYTTNYKQFIENNFFIKITKE